MTMSIRDGVPHLTADSLQPTANRQQSVSVLHLSAAESMLFPILRDQLRYLSNAGFEVHTASIDGPWAHKIRDEEHLPWTALPLSREIAPFSDWRALKFIENLCREKRFTIVHTHTPKGNVVGQWAARRAGVPVVLQTLHGFYFHDRMPWWKRRVWKSIERFSASHSDFVLCQNPEDVDTAVRERIIPAEKIMLLGNGIDLEKFTATGENDPRRVRIRQELNIPANACVVGMVGRFVAEKGFPEFISACGLICSVAPNIHIFVVGSQQPSERAGESWSPSSFGSLSSRAKVLTNRTPDEMPALYAAMDIHVLPSHREGFPRTLMEGAATGLPQICTNIRGCRQTVEDNKTGFLIEVGDVPALADRIRRLAADRELCMRMGRAAREKAEKEFDQRAVFQKVEQTYRRLLAARKPQNV
jgi:glycosyltransferase involved in cell wall biosynthesis